MITIYKASAGSGKTHTLTKEFLFLIFENHQKYKKILSVTFTNKAAGEMKERIITELATLATQPEKSAFSEIISTKFNFTESALKSNANIILKKILHNYSFFNISTIDSFVQRVIRAFVFELKIPANYAIELDNQKVTADLTDILLSKLNENRNLQKWLANYAFERISEGKKWDFRKNLIDFSSELFNEKFYGIFDDKIKSEDDFNKKISNFSQKIQKTISNFEKTIHEKVEKGLEIIQKSGLENVNISKIKYLKSFFYKNAEATNLDLNATLQKAVAENDFWNKTTKNDFKMQWENPVSELRNIVVDILEYEQKHGKKYYTATRIKTNLYSFGVINNLKNELPAYREENNLMLIIDMTMLLKKIIGNNEAPFIYEKIGSRYSHIMIDEFQDTSSFQWQNFKPLIANSVASNNFNLIVGDVKQSIYRWRNGDWRLLHSGVKNEIGKAYINETTLETNWRSKKNIVEFNNAFFNRFPVVLQEKINESFADFEISDTHKSLLLNAYTDAYQQIAQKNNSGGNVNLKFIEKNADYLEKIEDETCQLIDQLLETHNPGDIAILVRTNSDANKFMKLLLDYSSNLEADKQFNIVSAESLLISNSLAIRIITGTLNLILNPTQRILLLEIIVNYDQLFDKNYELDKIFSLTDFEQTKDFLPAELFDNFDFLSHLSLLELTEKIISIFGINKISSELPFVRSFEEVVVDFVRKKGSDLKSFLDFWNENHLKFSVQVSEIKNAMQIMTIHKSKGLAFNVVIMPTIDWSLEPNNFSVLWGATQNSEFNDFEFLPLSPSKELLKTDFANDYVNEKIYSYMDSINMLYVAFTRAKESIYGFVPISARGGSSSIGEQIFKTVSTKTKGVLQNENLNFIDIENFYDNENKIFDLPNPTAQKPKNMPETETFLLQEYPTNDWTKNISIVTHSEDLISEIVDTRQIAIKEGLLMHEIFSLIETDKDIDNAILKMKTAGKITDKDAKSIKIRIEKLFEDEEIKSWFSADWEVKAEKEILTRFGDTKIPDRVISNEKEIIVIDYKFGQKRSVHKKQVKHYMKLIEDIEKNKSIKGFLLYADNGEILQVL